MITIPFNKPHLAGNELAYIEEAVKSGKISGDGLFTKKCQSFFEERYGFSKTLLTTSCTDALEMAAILINIEPGDEVIMPSYTFVSTANAFVLRGAKLVFVDSRNNHPGMDEEGIEPCITEKTKAIVVVHYAGVSCDMEKIAAVAAKYGLLIIEDAAQAVESYFISATGEKKPLGSLGHLAAFSFHETKNIISGEGGMLVINDSRFFNRAEIIREKGTNRSAFFRGEVDKYGWVDIGSSFLPSDIISAFLFAQLEKIENIQQRRMQIWQQYYEHFKNKMEDYGIRLPYIPAYATNNAHMFYLVCRSVSQRQELIEYLKAKGVLAVFHYQSLHQSMFFSGKHDKRELPWSDYYSENLLRLPLYFDLTDEEVNFVINCVCDFFYKN